MLVDWTNTTSGESGRSVSDQAAWNQNPGIPINRTFPGTGTVDFTVTVQTGGGWWFINTQNAVCQGTIDVVSRLIGTDNEAARVRGRLVQLTSRRSSAVTASTSGPRIRCRIRSTGICPTAVSRTRPS